MSENKSDIGQIVWTDLAVDDAAEVRDFYKAVVGWEHQPVEMKGYQDYVMLPPGSEQGVAGVCYKRGENADLPSQWLMYIMVADLDASIKACTERGGEVISGPKTMGEHQYCVIKDPAGAVAALFARI